MTGATSRGDFFAIDHQVWGRVVALGMNAAISYLVLARGTGPDQRTTSWSTNAVEERTEIGRPKIKIAIAKLREAGLVREDKGGTKPRRYLMPAESLPSPVPVLTSHEKQFLEKLRTERYVPKVGRSDGARWGEITTQPVKMAEELAAKGILISEGAQRFRIAEIKQPSDVPDWVWLPNDLVDGAKNEVPPVELVRQSSSLPALRLLIDLYHVQSLQHASGVPFRFLRQKFERHKVGEQAQYVIWGFEQGTKEAWPDPLARAYLTGKTEKRADGKERDTGWKDFWDALQILEDIGLVEFVGHIVTADSDEGTVIHPYALSGTGEESERSIARQAHGAALAMLTDWQQQKVDAENWCLAPVLKHIRDATLVGIARMRYRARTSATAAWHDLEEWASFSDRFAAMQHQGDIKGTSKGDQRYLNLQ